MFKKINVLQSSLKNCDWFSMDVDASWTKVCLEEDLFKHF